MVSHAGVGLLREVAEFTGLIDGVTAALLDTYKGLPVHAPGRVFTDLACAVADGADCVSGIGALVDRQDLFGPVASMPTTWRLLDRIDAAHLGRGPVRRGRHARARAWAAGAAPAAGLELCLDFDATITIAHSEKEDAAPTWKRTFGFHPLLCFLDRPEVAGGEALAGMLRPGQRRVEHRRRPHHGAGPGAGAAARGVAAHGPGTRAARGCWPARTPPARPTRSPTACVDRGVGFSFGFPVDARIRARRGPDPRAVLGTRRSRPTASLRDGAWVAEATGMVDLDRLAAGLAADPAQGTPPPRRAADLHRRRRACGSPRC